MILNLILNMMAYMSPFDLFQVLSNYFKEKETQLQKELGTHEAKRAITEENVSESVKKILETEESLTLYKSQVYY